MRAVVQRVNSAKVEIDGKIVGEINKGLLVFLGISKDDIEEDLDYIYKKVTGLRIFEDENENMNLELNDVDGELLIVSQFTLYADARKGKRPSFIEAGRPEMSKPIYREFIRRAESDGYKVSTGEFGADMQVSLVNDGPVTILLDSKKGF